MTLTTKKPRDLVRTPTGETGTVVAILPNHERELRMLNGTYLTMREEQLYLVRSAPPLPWPDLRDWLKKRGT